MHFVSIIIICLSSEYFRLISLSPQLIEVTEETAAIGEVEGMEGMEGMEETMVAMEGMEETETGCQILVNS